jgi:hypothetical protein
MFGLGGIVPLVLWEKLSNWLSLPTLSDVTKNCYHFYLRVLHVSVSLRHLSDFNFVPKLITSTFLVCLLTHSTTSTQGSNSYDNLSTRICFNWQSLLHDPLQSITNAPRQILQPLRQDLEATSHTQQNYVTTSWSVAPMWRISTCSNIIVAVFFV